MTNAEPSRKTVVLSHDFLFERERGINVPKSERLIELIKEAGYAFQPLDKYLTNLDGNRKMD